MIRRWMTGWIPSIIIAIVLSLTIRTYVGEAVIIPSSSMEPTIQVHDRLFINKIMSENDLQDGDIVVFYPPITEKKDEKYIKRLIGKGGDTIMIRNGQLYRNGMEVDEPYLKEPIQYEFGPVTVPKGKFLFLGDNRNISFDSHMWPSPFVDGEQIIGKAIFRFYPFTNIGTM